MSLTVLRTSDGWWLRLGDRAVPVPTAATTTAELLADRATVEATEHAAVAAGAPVEGSVPVSSLALLSPVTTPCRVIAQMANYGSHARDAGLDPEALPVTFFRKASGSVCGPLDTVTRPAHVRLLDYEVELGLVIGAEVPVGTPVEAESLADLVTALVVTNDVSARDVQLPKGQFYESKSYPGFTPVGPALVLLESGDLARLPDLRLRLWVNGELRQDETAAGMIHDPVSALRTLTRFQALAPGDLVLTGTPVGTALSAPPKAIELIGSLLPPATKWRIFFSRQARNPRYLQDGDVVEVEIATDDGALDLGRQRTPVRWAR